MDTREAIIVNLDTRRPVLDVDPINLLVVENDQALFNDPLCDAMRTLYFLAEDHGVNAALVWSDDPDALVMVECDTCLRSVSVTGSTLLEGQEEDEGDGVMCDDCLA